MINVVVTLVAARVQKGFFFPLTVQFSPEPGGVSKAAAWKDPRIAVSFFLVPVLKPRDKQDLPVILCFVTGDGEL